MLSIIAHKIDIMPQCILFYAHATRIRRTDCEKRGNAESPGLSK